MRRCDIIMVFSTIVTASVSTAGATVRETYYRQADLQVSAFVLAEPRAVTSTQDLSQAAELQELQLTRGDPVSLRIYLANVGDTPTVPTRLIGQSVGTIAVMVTRPDGTVVQAVHLGRGPHVNTTAPVLQPMQPGEEQVLDTFLFEFKARSSQGVTTRSYLFSDPGEYTIQVTYKIGNPSAHILFESGKSQEQPPVINSAPITVSVLQDAIPGWEQLVDAGIADAIGTSVWPSSDGMAPHATAESLVTVADREWMTTWFETTVKPVDPNDE